MTALRQPDFYPDYSPQAQPETIGNQRQLVRQPQTKLTKVIKPKTFSSPNSLPSNLNTLLLLQKSSFGIAIASMTASIGLYISAVHIPKVWSQEYQHLESLQRQERQLIAINETLKYQIAQEASQDNRLAVSSPESAVFIPPAKISVKNKSNISTEQAKTVELKLNSFGY
ncbi:MAG: hypothetical protein ACFCU7_12655 [Pleurocapsa sp.]